MAGWGAWLGEGEAVTGADVSEGVTFCEGFEGFGVVVAGCDGEVEDEVGGEITSALADVCAPKAVSADDG